MLRDFILKTINYFSLFDFPLTKEEIFSNLWEDKLSSYDEVIGELELLKKEGKLKEQYGLYFFPGNSSFVEKRRAAVPLVEKKLRIARRAAKLISSVPFLKAVYVCNSLSMEMVNKESDIDFFIITEKNRAWTVRFFSNIIILLFGLRRRGNNVADKVCLSFYVDEENLNLERLSIGPDDVYLAYWLKYLLPLYDPQNIYDKLIAENIWQNKLLKNHSKQKNNFIGTGVVGALWKKIWESFWSGNYGDFIESQIKKIQMEKIMISSRGKVREFSSAVVIENGVLKFHEEDARAGLREEWINSCKEIKV